MLHATWIGKRKRILEIGQGDLRLGHPGGSLPDLINIKNAEPRGNGKKTKRLDVSLDDLSNKSCLWNMAITQTTVTREVLGPRS